MAPNFKRGIKWVVASLALLAIGAGCFIAGLIAGHRSEQTLMSSADTASILRALRRLEANDVCTLLVRFLRFDHFGNLGPFMGCGVEAFAQADEGVRDEHGTPGEEVRQALPD